MNKYFNKFTLIQGIKFASKAEARRYDELRNLERAKIISGLTLQPKFPLIVNGTKVCTYIGDFAYTENGKFVCEDVKGLKTAVYNIKRKLLLALQPNLDHREIGVRSQRFGSGRNLTAEIKQIFRDAERKRT